jgi:hypothetical protein
LKEGADARASDGHDDRRVSRRGLFEKFGVEGLPQHEKRARLVERAFAAGFVSERDL